ncbi:hypothetical protein GXW82_11925 [Streptacidiphilus sp. 4-A2]|nr:hypothetical protein [Streptacidiphilus sp. 4-A2]
MIFTAPGGLLSARCFWRIRSRLARRRDPGWHTKSLGAVKVPGFPPAVRGTDGNRRPRGRRERRPTRLRRGHPRPQRAALEIGLRFERMIVQFWHGIAESPAHQPSTAEGGGAADPSG